MEAKPRLENEEFDNVFYSKDYKPRNSTNEQIEGSFYSRDYDFKGDKLFHDEEKRLSELFPDVEPKTERVHVESEVLSSQKYIETRLDPIRRKFFEEIPMLTLLNKTFLILIIALTATATAFVAFEIEEWVPLVISTAAALEFMNSFLQLESRVPKLNGTATELTKTLLWWDGLTLIESRQPINKDRLVDRCEDAIVAQYESYAGSTSRFAKRNYVNYDDNGEEEEEQSDGATGMPSGVSSAKKKK